MKAIDIAGQKFGRLTVVEKIGSKKGEGVLWKCKCDCGGEVDVTGKKLRNGNTKSCGCIAKEMLIDRNKTQGHGMTNSPTWVTWMLMLQRCENPNHKSYGYYGGRGIKVCEQWHDFERFYADMGDRPEGMTIERNDPDAGYEPGNCRWATSEEQGNNKRSSRFVTYDGRTQTIAQWAAEIGISRQALRHRLEAGWSVKEALTMELNHGNGWKR